MTRLAAACLAAAACAPALGPAGGPAGERASPGITVIVPAEDDVEASGQAPRRPARMEERRRVVRPAGPGQTVFPLSGRPDMRGVVVRDLSGTSGEEPGETIDDARVEPSPLALVDVARAASGRTAAAEVGVPGATLAGTIVAADRAAVRLDGGRVVSLPSVSWLRVAGASAAPAARVLLSGRSRGGERLIAVAYDVDGLTWSAEHVVVLHGPRAELTTWVTLDASGVGDDFALADATIILEGPSPPLVAGRATLSATAHTAVRLRREDVEARRSYRYEPVEAARIAVDPVFEPGYALGSGAPVMAHVALSGVPLLRGPAHVMADDGSLLAEAELADEEGEASLALGATDEVTASRRRTRLRWLPGKRVAETFEITLENHTAAPARVRVIEHLVRAPHFRIDTAAPYRMVGPRSMEMSVVVPAAGTSKSSFQVTYLP